MARRWIDILTLWLIGVLAAAQLGKLAILGPRLREVFDLSLPALGLLISLLEVGGATLGFAAGLALARAGARPFLLGGVALLALAGLGEALAAEAWLLFAARAAEGFGYVLVVVAAPTLIAAIAGDRERGSALALWSTFVPVGVALGTGVTGLGVELLGLRGVLIAWAAIAVALAALSMRLPFGALGAAPRARLPAIGGWLSTFGFGIYTTLVCALTMLLPSYLIEAAGLTPRAASLAAAGASLAALPGFVLIVLLLRRGKAGARASLGISAVALTVSSAAALFVFPAGGGAPSGLVTAGLAALTVLIGGAVPPLMIARLPILAGARAPDDPRIATANGLLTQFGAGGALIGPPVGALIVEAQGWPMLGIAIAALGMLLLVLIALAEKASGAPAMARARA